MIKTLHIFFIIAFLCAIVIRYNLFGISDVFTRPEVVIDQKKLDDLAEKAREFSTD